MKSQKELRKQLNSTYFEYFFSLSEPTYRKAWEKTEIWFQNKYNFGKYTTYEGFRNAKSKYLNGLSSRKRHR